MTSSFSVARRTPALALLLIGTCGPALAPAVAQLPAPAVVDPNGPVERLGRYIRILAGSPRNLDALLGAGQAALDVGDANAALGFFARAEEAAPANGRAKAGLGSSLVMIERPDDALRLFAEAVSLGVSETEVARDRGLAYDLRGDSKRAQRDYALAMRRGADDELIRRYGLSLGISGDRAAALAMLDPLLRKQDQGAWRARAFVLAMTGDVAGANGVARQLMIPAMASAMSPLLARLATLNPAQRAHAVNFGTIPSDGTQMARVETGDPFLSAMRLPPPTPGTENAGAGLIPQGEPLGPRPGDTKPVRVAQADTRRASQALRTATPTPASPGFTTPAPAQRVGQRIAAIDPSKLPPEARGQSSGATIIQRTTLPLPDSVRDVEPERGNAPVKPTTAPLVVGPVPPPKPAPAPTPAPTVVAAKPDFVGPPTADQAEPAPAFETPPPAAKPVIAAPKPAPAPTAASTPTSSKSPTSRLAGLLEGIERDSETSVELPSARELRTARAAAQKKIAALAAQAAAEKAAKDKAAEDAAAAKRNPARLWVQVATGRNDSGLALTWKRIRGDNEAALKGLSAFSAPFKSTNRILAGPMKSAAAARELVKALARNGVSAMTYSSDAGEEVEKIATR